MALPKPTCANKSVRGREQARVRVIDFEAVGRNHFVAVSQLWSSGKSFSMIFYVRKTRVDFSHNMPLFKEKCHIIYDFVYERSHRGLPLAA